jgi:hypothetical protein
MHTTAIEEGVGGVVEAVKNRVMIMMIINMYCSWARKKKYVDIIKLGKKVKSKDKYRTTPSSS